MWVNIGSTCEQWTTRSQVHGGEFLKSSDSDPAEEQTLQTNKKTTFANLPTPLFFLITWKPCFDGT